jgi:rRNA biogenesis protein RRP5
MTKKYGSKFAEVWINYAHFLHATLNEPDRARALLPRAMQALDDLQSLEISARFAALEFRSPNGDAERGRTLFENLIAATPKRTDLWYKLVDQEIGFYATARAKAAEAEGKGKAGKARGNQEGNGKDGSAAFAAADPTPVRAVFERAARAPRLKAQWAKKWFKKWAKWEEENGDEQSRAVVSARAREASERIAAEAKRRAERREQGDEED